MYQRSETLCVSRNTGIIWATALVAATSARPTPFSARCQHIWDLWGDTNAQCGVQGWRARASWLAMHSLLCWIGLWNKNRMVELRLLTSPLLVES